MIYLLLFLSSLIAVIVLTPYLIDFLCKYNLVDIPDERKVHTGLTPRMGGLLIHFVATFLVLCFYNDVNAVKFLIIASFIIVICGLMDDGVGLKWSTKLFVQIAAVAFLLYHFYPRISLVTIAGIAIPFPLNFLIIFLFALGVINALNMMDGLDGLVSGFSFSIFVLFFALGFLTQNIFIMILSATLAGALLGFIKYNAFPSRIFLGDSGSLTLGFFLVAASIEVTLTKFNGKLDLTFPILVLALPILDTLRVMGTRILAGRSPFIADRNHLHHLILAHNVRHKTVVFIIQSFALIYLFAAICYYEGKIIPAYILFVVNTLAVVSIRSLLKVVIPMKKVRPMLKWLVDFPTTIIRLFDKYIFFISSIAFLIIYLASAFVPSPYSLGTVWFLLLFELILLFVAIYHNRTNYSLNHFYVFLNFLVFFSLTQIYSVSSGENIRQIRYLLETKMLYNISIILIASFVILFLISRNNIWSKTVIFFSGADLYIMIVTAFSFVLRNYYNSGWITSVSNCLLITFICFTWVKILMLYYKRLSPVFFYGTFVLSIFALVLMLVVR